MAFDQFNDFNENEIERQVKNFSEKLNSQKNTIDIAIDFDGTVVTHAYPLIGKDIGAVPVLKELIKNGHRLILNTMRSGLPLMEAVSWFKDTHHIELYGVNSNPKQKEWTESPKVYAQLYIDDAALGVPLIRNVFVSDRPYVNWGAVRASLIIEEIIKL